MGQVGRDIYTVNRLGLYMQTCVPVFYLRTLSLLDFFLPFDRNKYAEIFFYCKKIGTNMMRNDT